MGKKSQRLTLKQLILRKYPCIKESELEFVCRSGENSFNLYVTFSHPWSGNARGKTDSAIIKYLTNANK